MKSGIKGKYIVWGTILGGSAVAIVLIGLLFYMSGGLHRASKDNLFFDVQTTQTLCTVKVINIITVKDADDIYKLRLSFNDEPMDDKYVEWSESQYDKLVGDSNEAFYTTCYILSYYTSQDDAADVSFQRYECLGETQFTDDDVKTLSEQAISNFKHRENYSRLTGDQTYDLSKFSKLSDLE